MFDEVPAVAAVGPDLADAGVLGGALVQETGAGHGILHTRRGDQHREQESEGVGEHLTTRALTAGTGNPPPNWFRQFFTDIATASAEKLILADALGDLHLDADPDVTARLRSAVSALLQRTQADGTVRSDVSSDELIEWVAGWLTRGGRLLAKPTHFEARDGKF